MNKIAAIINDMGPSQKAFYMIKEFNKAAMSKDFSMSAFYSRPAMPITKPHFACSNISFLAGYDGAAIATDLIGADMLLKSHTAADKYLYIWDIEWLTNPVNFSVACDILLDDRLKLIARSDSHATVINNFCNKRLDGILDNWDIDELINIVTPL
jgi:hypothetical protein|tara:strand:- start:558 stop:1022 length:465 start_codon:yes stop_codon:yes gene_type:complete